MVKHFNIFIDLLPIFTGTPKGMNYQFVQHEFYKIPGVKDVHDLRIWSLSMDKLALSIHIAISKQSK